MKVFCSYKTRTYRILTDDDKLGGYFIDMLVNCTEYSQSFICQKLLLLQYIGILC